MPEERQMVLFSATMSKPIMAIANRYQRNPKLVKVVKNELTNVNIEQLYFDVKPKAKLEVMTRLIDFYQLKLILIFCNTKAKVDDVVENLLLRGYQAEGLHGDMRQQARTNVMNKFRGGSTSILVATDVAARGIDVDNVDAVINFDVPLDEEYYVHRIGRTGRAGKSGKAFTLIVGGERNRLRDVMAFTKVKIEKAVIPSFSDIVGIKKARFIEQVQETIQAGSLELFDDVLQNLTHAGFQSSEIVSALVKLSMNIQQSEFGDENLDGEFDRQNRKFSNERTGYDRGGYGGGSSYGNRDSRGGSSYGGRDNRGGSSYGNRDSRGGNDDRRGSYGNSEPRANDRPRFDQEGRPFKKAAGDGNMARIMINVGRNERITPSHIVGAIAGEAGVPGSAIGHIELQDRVTFVDVPKDMSARIIKAMDGNTIKGLRVNVKNA